ncbi:hypothetical protein Glove_221g62 [Diversispora epigaea]|uniref:Uncharacterized protein n=1 Tax=Diversispora epigaea TaxID=1348612 RepID=A0A397INH3_9GLOM|nr:hypothetical protein Glove_221g62 [Diversispora epigaea]
MILRSNPTRSRIQVYQQGDIFFKQLSQNEYFALVICILKFKDFRNEISEMKSPKRLEYFRSDLDAMEEFQQILKQIWKERCDKVIEWEVNNGITNKDKRIKQTKEKLNTNNQVVKTSNIRKRNNYNINNLKIIEEKEYIQNKQKQKKTNLEFFINEIPRLNNLGNDGPDGLLEHGSVGKKKKYNKEKISPSTEFFEMYVYRSVAVVFFQAPHLKEDIRRWLAQNVLFYQK